MLWELFVEPANLFFSISLCLMLMLGLVECLLMIFGSTSQGLLDQFIPEQIQSDHQLHIDFDTQANFLVQLLDWLYVGRVPMLVWLIIFLTVFGLFGLSAQAIFYHFSQSYLPVWIITPASLILAMPIIRINANWIAKVLPRDETTAIHSEELIGRTAHIILGDAHLNYPAQAKVTDQFGLTHYVLVEPETDITFKQGQSVILTQKTTIGFKAIFESNLNLT